MPRLVVFTLGLMWLDVLLKIPAVYFFLAALVSSTGRLELIWMLGLTILSLLIPFTLAVLIQRGLHWARIAYVGYFLLSAFFRIAVLTIAWSAASPLMAAKGVVELLLPPIALGLLFTPVSNAWFRARRRSRTIGFS